MGRQWQTTWFCLYWACSRRPISRPAATVRKPSACRSTTAMRACRSASTRGSTPTPVAGAAAGQAQCRRWPSSSGSIPRRWRRRRASTVLAGNRVARGRRADRARLCRPPVRPFRAAARRRARHPARRGRRPRRRAARHPAQGLRADAVLARRRRPRRARPGAARIHRQRGHGGARHSDHARRWPPSTTGEPVHARDGRCPARS